MGKRVVFELTDENAELIDKIRKQNGITISHVFNSVVELLYKIQDDVNNELADFCESKVKKIDDDMIGVGEYERGSLINKCYSYQKLATFFKCRQIYLLTQLHIPEIPGSQVRTKHSHLCRQRLNPVGLRPDQLEDIRVFLMRHNTGTGGKPIGKSEKTKISTSKQTHVCSQFPQCRRNSSQSKEYIFLHFPSLHLGVN